MYPEEYRALADAPWWKVWLHQKRSKAIKVLLKATLIARGQLEHERLINKHQLASTTGVINFLASRIK